MINYEFLEGGFWKLGAWGSEFVAGGGFHDGYSRKNVNFDFLTSLSRYLNSFICPKMAVKNALRLLVILNLKNLFLNIVTCQNRADRIALKLDLKTEIFMERQSSFFVLGKPFKCLQNPSPTNRWILQRKISPYRFHLCSTFSYHINL